MSGHKPLYLKHVGFVGQFDGGSKSLRDLVYFADGAPVYDIAIFTNYIVVGKGGETTKAYKKVADGIERGYNFALTPEQLIEICEGRTAPPEQTPTNDRNCLITSTAEAEENERQCELFIWQNKRDLYVERYGVPCADGTRVKINIGIIRAIKKMIESKKETTKNKI